MKDGKYSFMIVEDQQMPKALFSHFVESSDKFYLQVAIEYASVADIVCTRTPVDLILMDVVTENGENGQGSALPSGAMWKKPLPAARQPSIYSSSPGKQSIVISFLIFFVKTCRMPLCAASMSSAAYSPNFTICPGCGGLYSLD